MLDTDKGSADLIYSYIEKHKKEKNELYAGDIQKVRADICPCKACGAHKEIQLLDCGSVLKIRCPDCAKELSGDNWFDLVHKWNVGI